MESIEMIESALRRVIDERERLITRLAEPHNADALAFASAEYEVARADLDSATAEAAKIRKLAIHLVLLSFLFVLGATCHSVFLGHSISDAIALLPVAGFLVSGAVVGVICRFHADARHVEGERYVSVLARQDDLRGLHERLDQALSPRKDG